MCVCEFFFTTRIVAHITFCDRIESENMYRKDVYGISSMLGSNRKSEISLRKKQIVYKAHTRKQAFPHKKISLSFT